MFRRVEFQKQSYVMHKEACHSRDEYHNQVSSMQLQPGLSNLRVIYDGRHAQQQEGWNGQNKRQNGRHETSAAAAYYDNHVKASQWFPVNGIDTSLPTHSGLLMNNAMVDVEYKTSSQNKHQNDWHDTSAGAYYNNHAMAGQRSGQSGIDAFLLSHGGMFNNAMVNAEYKTYHKVHVPATVRVQEIRYEPSSWDSNGRRCHNYDDNFNWQHSDCEDVEWMLKGL